jgi:cell division protein FtsX
MKSSMTDLLHEALYGLMIEVVGWNYNDEDGFAERARDILTRYEDQRKASYSQRCVEAALRQRRHAHDLRKQARKIEATFAFASDIKPVAYLDARDALRDAIRWIQQAKIIRLKEQNAADMAKIREQSNEYRTAAE